MSKPPPPRYKIIERNGRLVTIDTWAKDATKSASPPRAALPPKPGPWRATRPSSPSVPAAGNAELLVAAVLRAQDGSGRRLLTTSAKWDRKGPRTIALSPAGERRLGRILLIALALAFGLVLLAIANLDWVIPVAIIAAVLFGRSRTSALPVLTRLFDSLGDDVS